MEIIPLQIDTVILDMHKRAAFEYNEAVADLVAMFDCSAFLKDVNVTDRLRDDLYKEVIKIDQEIMEGL